MQHAPFLSVFLQYCRSKGSCAACHAAREIKNVLFMFCHQTGAGFYFVLKAFKSTNPVKWLPVIEAVEMQPDLETKIQVLLYHIIITIK